METATDFVDLYTVLGVAETASEDEIRAAIKNQRRVWTKRQGSPDQKRRQEAEGRVHSIDQAEKVLLNTSKRRQFDSERRTQGTTGAPTPVETDGQRDWVSTAKQHLDRGEAARANYAAREAINANGSDETAWYIRAHSSFLLGNWRDSEYEFNEAIRLRPDMAEFHFDLGSVYEAARQWADALRKYEDALKIEPGNPMYKVAVASVYLNNGMPKRALPLVEEVVSAHPEVEAFQFYLAWALADNIKNYVTVLKDGSFVLTSDSQARHVLQDMERAAKLRFTESEMRTYIQERQDWAEKALKMTWSTPAFWWPWVVPLVIGLGLLFAGGGLTVLGLLIIPGMVFLYKTVHNVPGWKDTKRRLSSFQVETWGDGGSSG